MACLNSCPQIWDFAVASDHLAARLSHRGVRRARDVRWFCAAGGAGRFGDAARSCLEASPGGEDRDHSDERASYDDPHLACLAASGGAAGLDPR